MLNHAFDVLCTNIVFKTFEKNETAHIRYVSYRDPIVALKHINQHHHKEVLVSVRIKVPKPSKRYLVCFK